MFHISTEEETVTILVRNICPDMEFKTTDCSVDEDGDRADSEPMQNRATKCGKHLLSAFSNTDMCASTITALVEKM